jgi:flagellin
MISINTNTASSFAAYNLTNANVSLQRSLNRLSSGSRINSSFDDAGGLAVSMRLSAALRRTEATQANVNNAMSFLQTQDGVLKNADKILARMSELAQLSTDVTKSTSDKALYQTEYNQLTAALNTLTTEEFNDVGLFTTSSATAGSVTVITSQDAAQSVSITRATLGSIVTTLATIGTSMASVAGAGTADINTLNTAIQNLATLRATNGAEQSRLSFAADLLAINRVNLEAANGRIVDVDVASESANLARLNILQQAGTAMLAQANQSSQSILALLT